MQHLLSVQAALRRVAFQNVGASIKACAAIAELLPDAAALEQLHLFNNMSGDEGAAAIGSLLVRAPAMTDFRMASSRVGAEGAIALAQGLSSGRTLSALIGRCSTCAMASVDWQQQMPPCADSKVHHGSGAHCDPPQHSTSTTLQVADCGGWM